MSIRASSETVIVPRGPIGVTTRVTGSEGHYTLSLMREAPRRLSAPAKLALALRIWGLFLTTYVAVKRRPLPEVIADFPGSGGATSFRVEPRRLAKIVRQVLRLGPWQARCLWAAMVLYRLLRLQGDRPELVIGLPVEPRDKDAHAWVELGGVDVGPPPGRAGHQEMARYG